MNRYIYIALLILIAVGLVSVSNFQSEVNPPQVLHVPDDYASIQEAIDHSPEGSIILIGIGEYMESLVISKSISLRGASSGATILNGGTVPRFDNNAGQTFITLEIANQRTKPINVNIQNISILADNVDNPGARTQNHIAVYARGSVFLHIDNSIIAGETGIDIGDVGAGGKMDLISSEILSSSRNIHVRGTANGFFGDTYPFQAYILDSNLMMAEGSGSSYSISNAAGASTNIVTSEINGSLLLEVGGHISIIDSILHGFSGVSNHGSQVNIYQSVISDNERSGITIIPYQWGESFLNLQYSSVTNNAEYGIQVLGSECSSSIDTPALSEYALERVRIVGSGNKFIGNAQDICPADYPFPVGFIAP